LKLLFELFDKDGNGQISANEINLDYVSTEILVIFKPLLIELETFDEALDQEEFIASALALCEKLDVNSKSIILNLGKRVPRSLSNFETENRFKPQISKKSQVLAGQQRSRREGGLPIEKRLLI
jgi:hypothetical protein